MLPYILVTFPSLQNRAYCEKILEGCYNLHLARKYARRSEKNLGLLKTLSILIKSKSSWHHALLANILDKKLNCYLSLFTVLLSLNLLIVPTIMKFNPLKLFFGQVLSNASFVIPSWPLNLWRKTLFTYRYLATLKVHMSRKICQLKIRTFKRLFKVE